jgi:predicted porin
VNVYGKLDAGWGALGKNTIDTAGNDVADKATRSSINFSQFWTSRIGFKASEDLGSGMKITSTIESGVTGGTTSLGDRELNLALALGQGTTIKGGYGTTTLRNIAYGYDAIYGSNLIGNLLTDTKNKNGLSTTLTARSVSIEVAHSMGDLKLSGNLMADTTTHDGGNDTKVGNGFELGAQYAADALSVGGAYRSTKDTPGNASTLETTNKAFILGASFDLGVAKISGQYASVKVEPNTGPATTDSNGESVGVDVPFMPSLTGFAQLSFAKEKTTDQKSTGYALGVKYDMSKSAFGYVDYGSTKMDGNANGTGLKATQYTIGLVQSF